MQMNGDCFLQIDLFLICKTIGGLFNLQSGLCCMADLIFSMSNSVTKQRYDIPRQADNIIFTQFSSGNSRRQVGRNKCVSNRRIFSMWYECLLKYVLFAVYFLLWLNDSLPTFVSIILFLIDTRIAQNKVEPLSRYSIKTISLIYLLIISYK